MIPSLRNDMWVFFSVVGGTESLSASLAVLVYNAGGNGYLGSKS